MANWQSWVVKGLRKLLGWSLIRHPIIPIPDLTDASYLNASGLENSDMSAIPKLEEQAQGPG